MSYFDTDFMCAVLEALPRLDELDELDIRDLALHVKPDADDEYCSRAWQELCEHRLRSLLH